MDKVNWDEAPEWAVNYAKMDDKDWRYWLGEDHYSLAEGSAHYPYGLEVGDGENYQRDDFTLIATRPLLTKGDVKPVYTQEMKDNGELPAAGMECLIINSCSAAPNYNKATIKYMGDLVIYAYVEDGERCDSVRNLKFKPLTPPIVLEDGKAYQFDYKGEHIGLYEKDDDLFIGIGINHAREICTNIKLLTAD